MGGPTRDECESKFEVCLCLKPQSPVIIEFGTTFLLKFVTLKIGGQAPEAPGIVLGAMAHTPESELYDLFTNADLEREDAELVAADFGVHTITLFVNAFESPETNVNFAAQMFDRVTLWKDKRGKLPRLRQA